jgi:uncharacterized protein
MKIIDMHVHMVGNGSGGSGCWIRSKGWRKLMHWTMARHVGLPISALKGDLDQLYAAALLRFVRASSLDAVVILAQERVYDGHGHPRENCGTAYVPNEYVLKLAREHPEFLPAVSIHPGRPDALTELERCLDGGAVMMKYLPASQNIDLRERRYTSFFERMAEAGLPMLVHTGGEKTLEVVRWDLTDPRILELPLQCGVTVIAAHCATKSAILDRQFFQVFVEMLGKHPRLYGDNSAFHVPIRGSVVPKCLKSPVVERMVHGSDFPVPVFGHWTWLKGRVDWNTFRRWEKQPNPLERDYQLKRAMGFPNETFTRIGGLLRLSQ